MVITFEHSRIEWQNPSHPVRGPQFSWNNLKLLEAPRRKPGIVIHYGGVADMPDGDIDEPWSVFDDTLRSIDAFHRRKGYSFAYSFILDSRGHLWQGRGVEYRNAANNGDKFYIKDQPLTNQNLYTVSVLCAVDSQDKLTDAATTRMQQFVAEVRAMSVATLPYRPHSFYDYTSCPGAGIHAQIALKAFDKSVPNGETYVNWTPSPATVASVKDAPPVTLVLANKANDWVTIAMLKVIQEQNGLPVTGRYDQRTAEVIDRLVASS